MYFCLKMRSLSRFYFRLNSAVCDSKVRKLGLLHSLKCPLYRDFKLLRYQSNVSRSFEGPGLADFIAKEAAIGAGREELLSVEKETVPYVNESDYNGRGRKVCFLVHGCQMNTSDIEIVWSILKSNGYQRTTEECDANVILIMTCAIRESAEEKILHHLRRLGAFKRKNPKKQMKIGVLGCMAERLKEKLIEKFNEVDLVAGPDSYKDLPRLLALTGHNQKAVNILLSLEETYADIVPVKLNENEVSAYVSIMRGCDNMCSYCIVPFTRGRERSRPLESILNEVKLLSDQGIKQVTLLGQNVNSYRDISASDAAKEPSKLADGFKTVYKSKIGGLRFDVLLDKVSQIDPNMRIRFTAPHPKDFPDEVLYLIRDRKNICRCLHLPVQSGSNAVLERMRRGYTVEAYLSLVEHIRSIIPNISFTTDIITGFCGETEKDHEDTLELLRKVKFSFVYHFSYSMREKTTAYRRYSDDVPKEVKMRRSSEISQLFRSICLSENKTLINQTHLVLIEGVSKKSNMLFGRNDGNSSVFIPISEASVYPDSVETKPIQPGNYVAVQIIDVNAQSLFGKPLYHTSVEDFDESATLTTSKTQPFVYIGNVHT